MLSYRPYGEKGHDMNRIRRKSLQEIIDQLEELKINLEDLKEKEEEARDGIPEQFQETEGYKKAEAACDNLEDAVSDLEEVISSIESAIE